MNKFIFIALVIFNFNFGCNRIWTRVEAYQALPTEPEEFEEDPVNMYYVLIFDIPTELAQLEQGFSWEIKLKSLDGESDETAVATRMVLVDADKKITYLGENGDDDPLGYGKKLFSLIHPDQITDWTSVIPIIVSHSKKICWGLDGEKLATCKNWKKSPKLNTVAQKVHAEETFYQQIKGWYEKASQFPMVQEKNFALCEEVYEEMKGPWYIFLVGPTISATSSFLTITALGSLSTGGIVGGTTILVYGGYNLLFPEKPQGPEYSDSAVTKAELLPFLFEMASQAAKK